MIYRDQYIDSVFIFILYSQHCIVCVVVVILIIFWYFERVPDCTRGFAVDFSSKPKGTLMQLIMMMMMIGEKKTQRKEEKTLSILQKTHHTINAMPLFLLVEIRNTYFFFLYQFYEPFKPCQVFHYYSQYPTRPTSDIAIRITIVNIEV